MRLRHRSIASRHRSGAHRCHPIGLDTAQFSADLADREGHQTSCWSVVLARMGCTTSSRRAHRGSRRRRDRGWGSGRWPGQRCCAQFSTVTVGHGQAFCGTGDGDDAPMVQPMMIRTQQHQIIQLGGPAVLPMPDVVRMQTTGGPATGNRTGGMAVLQCTPQPAADLAGRPARPDDLAVAFEPHLTRGITQQVSAIRIGEQRTQMQRRDLVLDIKMHHHGGAMPMRAARRLGIPPRINQTA